MIANILLMKIEVFFFFFLDEMMNILMQLSSSCKGP